MFFCPKVQKPNEEENQRVLSEPDKQLMLKLVLRLVSCDLNASAGRHSEILFVYPDHRSIMFTGSG